MHSFKIIRLVLLAFMAVSGFGQTPSFKSFNTNDFIVTPPTIRTRNNNTNAVFGTVTITNLYAGTANITNGFIQNLYVTQQIISSNTVSGNIQGTVGMLPIFGPTTFDLADSGLHKTDTNTYVFDGTGDASVTLFGTSPQIVFGGGGTNVLMRSGPDLVYTNGDLSQVRFIIEDGAGDTLSFTSQPGSSANITPSNGALEVVGSLFTRLVRPLVGKTYDIGADTSAGAYRDAFLAGNLNVIGFGDENSGNYSQLRVRHSGTNGAIVFDSQSGGTAGSPRPFVFTNATLTADTTGGISLGGVTRTSWPSGIDTNADYSWAGLHLWTKGLSIGPNTPATTGTWPTNGEAILALNDTTLGDPNLFRIFVGARNATHTAWVDSQGTATTSSLIVLAEELDGSPYTKVVLNAQTNAASIVTTIENQVRTSLNPTVADGASAVAYLFDTTSTLSDGAARLAAFQNQGADKFSVHATGAIILGGVTKTQKAAITPVDGMLVYQTDNTPGLRAYIGGAWVILQTAADP